MYRYLWVWLAAITLSTAVIVGIKPPPYYKNIKIPETPVIFIGTSLFEHAIPSRSHSERGVLADSQRHLRLGARQMSEEQVLTLAEMSLSSSSNILFLEIYPFIRDFAKYRINPLPIAVNQHEPSYVISGFHQLLEMSEALRGRIKETINRSTAPPTVDLFLKEPDFTAEYKLQLHEVAKFYPLYLRQPNNGSRLTALVHLAQEKQARIYFVAPPRSELALEFISPDAFSELQQQARQVAADYNIPLVDLNEIWPRRYFYDQAHLNKEGRVLFLQRFRETWEQIHER